MLLNNPRNYKYLPAEFTERISVSGKLGSRVPTRDLITHNFINGFDEKTEKDEQCRKRPDAEVSYNRQKNLVSSW